MSQIYCIVDRCRFPDTHTIISHKCGSCGKFGHGMMECNDPQKIKDLITQSKGIRIPRNMYCTSLLCPCPWTHTASSHYCVQCGERHLESSCSHGCSIMNDPSEVAYAISEAKKRFGSSPGKIYTIIYCSQGCAWYVKRKDVDKMCMLFFMHSDAQEQRQSRLEIFCKDHTMKLQ
jgi:hypothetical protein